MSDLLNQILLDHSKEIVFNKGEQLFKQGTFNPHVFFIKKGMVKTYIQAENQKKIILDLYIEDEILHGDVLDIKDEYQYSAQALTDTNVIMIKPEGIQKAIDNGNDFYPLYRSIIAKEKKHLYKKTLMFGTKNMHGRLASAILYLTQPKFIERNIFKYFQRKDIAEFAVMSIESMNKIMQELKEDLIIKVNSKDIIVNDDKMLRQLSRFG